MFRFRINFIEINFVVTQSIANVNHTPFNSNTYMRVMNDSASVFTVWRWRCGYIWLNCSRSKQYLTS